MRGPIPESWRPHLLSVLRIVVAFLFIAHGTQKLFGFPAATPPMATFAITSKLGIAGVLETFGGGLMLLGLFTRPVAFLLCGEMAVAYFTSHAPAALLPIANRGELAVLYCSVYLYLASAGGGPWSVDAMMAKPRT